MKPVQLLSILYLLLAGHTAFSQGENNIWCFGEDQGLNFNAGPPTLYPDSIFSIKGSSSVCDASGHLLFYSSGLKAWDRNNHLMPNGTGLLGNTNITQGSAIGHSFTNPDQYYLFYITTAGKLYYSLVDMTLNFGYGDIVAAQKNILIDSLLSEKMIFVKGTDGNWLLVHKKSAAEFHAFKLDITGFNTTPVISTSGLYNNTDCYKIGEMKVSPDYTRLVLANYNNNTVEINSFDNSTGIASNAIFIDTNTSGKFYGASFSPNGTRLYIGKNSGTGLYQYDLTLLPNAAAVQASKTTLATSTVGGMRIGPDQKIYLTIPYAYLSVINDPNQLGVACNYTANVWGPMVKGNAFETDLGNPFIPTCAQVTSYSSKDTTLCVGAGTASVSAPSGYTYYQWSDGTMLQSDTFSAATTKTVSCFSSCSILVDTIRVHIATNDTTTSAKDTTICFLNNVATLNAPWGYQNYLWSDGITTESDTFSAATTKIVYCTASCFVEIDTFRAHAEPLDTNKNTLDTNICMVDNVPVLSAPGGYNTYAWSDGMTTQSDTFGAATTKVVYAIKGCNIYRDSIKVIAANIDTTKAHWDTSACMVNNIPVLPAPAGYTHYLWSDGQTTQSDTFSTTGHKIVYAQLGCIVLVDTINLSERFDTIRHVIDTAMCVVYIPKVIAAHSGFTSYLWSDGITTQSDTFLSTTTKWVYGHYGCALLIDSVHFTATTIPSDSIFTRTNDSFICFEATPTAVIDGPYGYPDYLWSDGTVARSNTFSGPGLKWVYAQKGCLMAIDTFGIFNKPTDTILHSLDSDVCFAKQATVTAAAGYLTYSWSTGETANSYQFTGNSVNWVYMHKACAERIDTFKMRFIDALTVYLGADTALCKGHTMKLDARSGYTDALYQWQDNSSNAEYTANSGGTYWVKVSVGKCFVTDTIRIQDKVLKVDLGNGTVPCGQNELVLDAGYSGAAYTWQNGSTSQTVIAKTNGTYSVHVVEGDCSGDGKVDVTFESCPCVIYIPNAFSPNQDGLNDQFGPRISCPISGFEFRIYNRWGNLIFYTENQKERWDGNFKGTAQDNDLYYYYIQFKDETGHNYYYKGDVTLVK
ncbi:MAG: gliding motility-associated C-terminal domain-containing protein [Bacteroidetes bacterium]|nr:gliding motility-associated C-terminal domain-containing protein [Bacteroidota bacterium]